MTEKRIRFSDKNSDKNKAWLCRCGKRKGSTRAQQCVACYHARGSHPRHSHDCACGARLQRPEQKQCVTCYRTRGRSGPTVDYGTCELCPAKLTRHGQRFCGKCYNANRVDLAATGKIGVVAGPLTSEDGIRAALKSGPKRIEDIAKLIGQTPGQTLDLVLAMRDRGMNLHDLGGQWSLERAMPLAQERTFEYVSRPDNTFLFGVSSDQHLGSRYAREDVLTTLYDKFAQAGVDRVFNAGNWIDGEDDKNRFDLSVHGLEPQIDYLVGRYPKRDGITTYAIWGEDHEGWFARRESIDIGRFAESKMREAGREDWIDLGFVEARVDLVNANTGARNTLVVMHPGGGSSYAYSYRSQKIVESLSGGEKPGVLLIGHYHKLNLNIIRNVWTAQCGCAQDQTVFMRKKGLDAQIGGLTMMLEQDPETGAIFRCVADQMIFYDRAYYNDRWSKTRPVVQAPRFLGGVKAAS